MVSCFTCRNLNLEVPCNPKDNTPSPVASTKPTTNIGRDQALLNCAS